MYQSIYRYGIYSCWFMSQVDTAQNAEYRLNPDYLNCAVAGLNSCFI